MERKAYVENNDYQSAVGTYLERFERLGDEDVDAVECVGRILSHAVYAKTCDPVYNAAAMDGIAVLAAKTEEANERRPLALKKGTDFEYVNTGNLVEARFDSVIMIEDVIVIDENNVEIIAPSHPFQHVRVVGESVVAIEMVLAKDLKIRALDLGAILASGNDSVRVVRQPKVGIIPTGNEMVESANELKIGKLRESNTRVFAALTKEYGGIAKRYDIVVDDENELEKAVSRAVKENDVVIINAGSSAGSKDYTVRVIERLGKVFTHGLNIKPGKPTILGEIEGKPVIGVPGYPVSAYIVFMRVVHAVIARLAGYEIAPEQIVNAELTKRVTSALKNEEYVRVAVGDVDGKIVATPLERGAAALMSMVKADGIVRVSAECEGIEAGETVSVELLKPMDEIKKALVIVGSHDMIVDVIGDEMRVSSAHVGSTGGILAMQRNACNVAPIHLLDEKSGKYNVEYVKKFFPNEKMALVKGVGRVQGIMVEKGNPKNIKSVDDIKSGKFLFANRQNGAGTRILFDYLINKKGISPDDIKGYDKEFTTHLAVATAVKSKTFDCGLGVKSAANTMGLDFVAVGNEEYDFLVRADFLSDERMKKFVSVLKSKAFQDKVNEIGGYDCTHSGEIVYVG